MKSVGDALSKKQKKTLEKHSNHHTKKHMSLMKRLMKGGTTFSASHKKAQQQVGS